MLRCKMANSVLARHTVLSSFSLRISFGVARELRRLSAARAMRKLLPRRWNGTRGLILFSRRLPAPAPAPHPFSIQSARKIHAPFERHQPCYYFND